MALFFLSQPTEGQGFLFMGIRSASSIFAVALWLAACGGQPSHAPPPARTVTDGLGRTVALPEKVERAISLAPNITELVFEAGGGDRLVGVTSYCNFPPAAAGIAKIGDTQTPNIEAIVALGPDVVFVSTASQLEAFKRTLEEQRIAVYVVEARSMDDVFRSLEQIGDVMGTPEHAAAAANALRTRAREIASRVEGREKVRVFVQISRDPLYTIGRDSFLTELVERAGGTSLTQEIATPYPTLSKETAMAMDPEAIVLSDSEDNRTPNSVFDRSRAVRSGRVLRVDADVLSRPGPRLVDALEQIASFLHPGG
jgi:ABC-type Fe3+-hydroxamate transport system substrate-binding protein